MTMRAIAPDLFQAIVAIVGKAHAIPEGRHCHITPASSSELSQLAILIADEEVSLIPVGKGGHSTPTDDLRPQLLLNMKRMNHVLHLDEVSLLVHVQAGLSGLDLERILNTRELTLGDFPIDSIGSTIGGLLSVRTPGKSTRRHGTFEDTVLGVSAVLSDGKSIRTRVAPRRASGPDLSRVLCGSEGALGIITSAVLRIHKQPESRLLAAYKLPSFADALSAVRLALREEASPAALRIYDDHQAQAHLGLSASGEEALLVVATVGPTSLAACDRNLFSSAVEAYEGRPSDKELATTWWDRRCGHVAWDDAPAPPNLEVSATPGTMAQVYRAIKTASTQQGLHSRAHASRFNTDGGVLFFTISERSGPSIPGNSSQMQEIKDSAESAGAYLIERVNPSLKSYFESLRDQLDAKRHLNPGVLRSS